MYRYAWFSPHSGDALRMHLEQHPIIFQISMPCSTMATAFKLASLMEIVENKRDCMARRRCQWREGWRAMDFGIQSIFWQIVGRLGRHQSQLASSLWEPYARFAIPQPYPL